MYIVNFISCKPFLSASILQTILLLDSPAMPPTIPKTVMRHLNDSTRQRLKAQTEAPVSWTTGVPYDQPHGDLSDYQVFRPRARATLTKAKATQLLVDFLTPIQPLHESQKAALTRLNGATNKADWDPSLVIKALGDLDVAFFDGWLRGNLIAVWATEEKIVEQVYDGKKPVGNFAGLCQTLDRRENEGEQRCKVWLNSDVIFDVPDPRLKMWEVIFHELVVSSTCFYFNFSPLKKALHDQCH